MRTIIEAANKKTGRPIKVVQFGEGNFLRAFVDYMIDVANEAGVMDAGIALVKPITFGTLERFDNQDNLYTVILRGKQDGQVVNDSRIVSSVERCVGVYEDFEGFMDLAKLDSLEFVVSNTTEAGIVLDKTDSMDGIPNTYPGKLTKFLHTRFEAFAGDVSKGLIMLPVELIENNGGKLKECVLALADIWNLSEEFKNWVAEACVFCSTLVDRIVTGYPRDEAAELCEKLGYQDDLLDVAEPFGLWVIESDKDISDRFPLDKAGMPVVFTDNQKPYRERKVRILNGAHTSTVLLGWLCGLGCVRDCMEDKTVRAFMEKAVRDEIMPFVKLPKKDVEAFAEAVFERFENPFIYHKVLDISLNSVSKWKARVLPSFKDYYAEFGKIPAAMTLSFAALMAFYTADKMEDGALAAVRADGTAYAVRDDAAVLEFMLENAKKSAAEYAHAVVTNEAFWGEDMSKYEGFEVAVCEAVDSIRTNGARATAEKWLKEKC
ncbi:MAG: tagaturonate reductase [Faecalimonas sp.]|nr:tagaturonate reductase [Faecalimonas sp.]